MDKLENLYYRRRRLFMNRNICVIAGCLLAFSVINTIREGAPFYFPVIMGLMVVVLVMIALKGHAMIKIVEKEISEAESVEKTVDKPETY